MLTPTGVTYADYWDAIKAGNPTHVRFTFLGQGIVLEDEDVLLSSGVNLTDMFNGDTDLVFGRTLSKQITVMFINSNRLNGLQWTGEFTLEFGVEISGTTNWVTIGYFSGEKPKNVTSVQTIAFTAYDRMGLFDTLADEFIKSISYPKTVQQIYDSLCSYVGLQNVSGDELVSIMSRSFSSAPADMQGYSCRDLLGFIAEACGCYAKITADGKVKLVWFTDNTAHAVTGTEEFRVESGDINDGMTWDEADTYTWDEFDNFTWDDVCGYQEALRVDRLYVKQLSSDMDINYPYSYGDNVYAIVDNPFLSVSTYSDVTTYLAPIYNRLYNFGGYLPVQLECVGNWCVEAGDIITIDVNNLTITFPVFVKTMRWSGAINDSYETTASGKRQIYKSEATKQKVLTSNKIEMYVTELEEEVDSNYYKIRSGITIAPEGVTISGGRFINITSPSGSVLIDGNGVDITGNKYVRISANSNSRWVYDEKGLSLFDINRKYNAMQFGGSFDSQSLNTEAGVYAYNPGGDTTHGRLAFVATNLLHNFYSFMALEYDTFLCLYPSNADGLILGKSGSPIREINGYYYDINNLGFIPKVHMMDIGTSTYHINRIYGSIIFGNNNSDGFRICPINDASKEIYFTKENNSDDFFTIYSTFKSGNTYTRKKLRLYGEVVAVSSRSQKDNIKKLNDVGEIIDKLEPVSFVYKNDDKKDKHFGLIYEDTIDTVPEICVDSGKEKGVNYVELVPLLLKEIQDLRKRVSELEEEVKG